MVKIKFTVLLLLLFALSCSRYPDGVEQALRLAGDNRAELEQVLEYYRLSGDKPKYRAAEYLIGNMPGKYSEDIKPTERYVPLFDRWRRIDSVKNRMNESAKVASFDSLLTTYGLASGHKAYADVNYIRADYLINHIEQSFKVWREQPWGKDIPFDAFCEDILPYRISTEPLEDWRGKVLTQYQTLYDSLKASDMDAVAACIKVLETMDDTWYHPAFNHSLPELSYSMVEKFRTGYCTQQVMLGIYLMRALGIPVAWEFTPQWAYRSNGHDWNAVRNKDGKYIPFIITDIKPGEPHRPGERMAKAYRHTYGRNPESPAMLAPEEAKPRLFRNPFIRDVSSGNFESADVSIPLKRPPGDYRYVYLAVWDNRNWYPIRWGKSNPVAVFTGMGKDIAYLPVCYREQGLVACGSPFILTRQGDVRMLEADTSRRQTLTLNRKHPLIYKWIMELMKDGQFQGANRPDFSDAVTLYAIPDHPELVFQEVFPAQPCQYRYYRYLSPPGGGCNIAELEFYGADGARITGQPAGTPGSYDDNPERTFDRAFDGDVLTYYDAANKDGAWVGMDFGRKTALTKIRYLPRNDDNEVAPGQLYELFYRGPDGWVSLGQQIAAGQTLSYDHAPLNALFLLRNLTKGKEERIFTYENGKQVWW